jgi:hypothetical protein
MKHLVSTLPILLSAMLVAGCASDFESTGTGLSRTNYSVSSRRSDSGSNGTNDSVTYDTPSPSNDIPSPSVPDTSAQDAINQMNQQMATQQANDAAQQQFLAGMAAAQETENQANSQQPPN